MILAGDIGGTKTILGLFEQRQEQLTCIARKTYPSGDYRSFAILLAEFLEQHPANALQAACIGVAGPILDGHCEATNLPWSLQEKTIGKQLGTSRMRLLNDLEAAAWGILTLSDEQLVDLNPEANSGLPGNIGIIAAGTGLGEAMLYWDGRHYHVLPTEGGHTDFGPNDARESELLAWLRRQYSGHVSYERLLSGTGLVNIYHFLLATGEIQENPETARRMQVQDPAAVIGETALSGNDALCSEALRLFCRIYGAEAGNLALNCLSYAGIYLVGGIAAKILPGLQHGEFMAGFLDKGRYTALLQKIPVRVCLDPEVALTGAASFARTMIQENK